MSVLVDINSEKVLFLGINSVNIRSGLCGLKESLFRLVVALCNFLRQNSQVWFYSTVC